MAEDVTRNPAVHRGLITDNATRYKMFADDVNEIANQPQTDCCPKYPSSLLVCLCGLGFVLTLAHSITANPTAAVPAGGVLAPLLIS